MAIVVVAFAALCLLAVRQGRRFHHSASIWLAVSFASLAVAGAMATQLDVAQTPAQGLAAVLGTAAGLVVHPIALMQFAHTLQPTSRTVRLLLAVVSGSLLVATAVITGADPAAFDDEGGDLAPAATVVLAAISGIWLGVSLVVGARLIRLGRRLTSSVGQVRAWTMSAGVLILAPAVALPFLLSGLTQADAVTGALIACGLLYVGYLPPRWLRWAWARRDTLQLTAAELDTLRAGSENLEPWLQTIREVWDGHAAWFEMDGRVVASAGGPPTDLGADTTGRRPAADDVRVERLDHGTWHLIADVSAARLTVATTLDPVLFGDDASDLLMTTAARLLSTETRRALEEETRRQQAERHTAETSRLRDDVLSTLSHELRTPLVTIRGIPELMLQRWDDLTSEEAHHLLDRLHVNALSLHRLVETTLLLAQVRAGEARPRRFDVPVGSVVDEGMGRLRRVGLDLERVAIDAGEDATVHTDPMLAGAALAELVHNALLYSDAPSQVHVSARQEDGVVHLQVADQGRGIKGTDATFVQAFDRAGELLTRDRRGLGLGLTLVSDLSLLLHTDMHARPREGGGTVMTMALPAAPARRSLSQPRLRPRSREDDRA